MAPMDMSGLSEELSRAYSLLGWVEDPYSPSGKQRFEGTLRHMKLLVDHEWVKDLVSGRDVVRILEICSGTGFGGVALAKTLIGEGTEAELLLTDLRRDALKVAEKWGREVLGREIEVSVADAREVHKLGRRFDIALIYGLSTPHFDPWDIARVFASVSEALVDDGIFVIDEADRRYTVFLTRGYKEVLAESASEGRLVVSFHMGYDPLRGLCKRVFADLIKRAEPVTLSMFLWGLAEVASLAWLFFNDVDLVNLGGVRYFILGREPRRALSPGDLREPALLRKIGGKA